MEIELSRNAQKDISFTLIDDTEQTLTNKDLTEIIFTCKTKPAKDSPILFEKKMYLNEIIYDSENREFVVAVKNEDIKDLEYKDYGFGIWYKQGDFFDEYIGRLKITEAYAELD